MAPGHSPICPASGAAPLTPLFAAQGYIRFDGEFYANGCYTSSSIDEYRVAMGGNGAGIWNGSDGEIVFKQAVEMHFCGDWVCTNVWGCACMR